MIALLTLAALLVQPVPVVTETLPTVGPARAPTPELAATLARGQLLFVYDQAAWHATEAMLKDVRDPAAAGVRGWIIGSDLRVTFYGTQDGQPVAIYVADYKGGRKVGGARLIPKAERRPLEPEQQRLIRARSTPGAEKLERCVAQPFNTVVVPGLPGGPLDVYYLTPQTKGNVWPVGRHYKMRVAPDGTVADARAFSRSCLEIGTAGMPKGRQAGRAVRQSCGGSRSQRDARFHRTRQPHSVDRADQHRPLVGGRPHDPESARGAQVGRGRQPWCCPIGGDKTLVVALQELP